MHCARATQAAGLRCMQPVTPSRRRHRRVCCPAATEFIRVPAKSEHPSATVRGLTADYAAQELGSVPLAAQLMGSSTQLLAAAARHLVDVKGAPRIDLNCGESAGRQRRVRLSRANSTNPFPPTQTARSSQVCCSATWTAQRGSSNARMHSARPQHPLRSCVQCCRTPQAALPMW